MRVVMESNMNRNTTNDVSNLNVSANSNLGNHGIGVVGAPIGGAGGNVATSSSIKQEAPGPSPSNKQGVSNSMDYLRNLADLMSNQESIGNQQNNNQGTGVETNFQGGHANTGLLSGGPTGNDNTGGSNNTNSNMGGGTMNATNPPNFRDIRATGGSDTDTCASSYATRRISRDSIVSHGSLSDMLRADQVASNNIDLAMMSMLQKQQGGGGNGNSNNSSFNLGNSFNSGQLNQSMSQLMMNGGMNQMGQMGGMNNTMGNFGGMNQMGVGGGMGSMSTAPLAIPPKKTKNKHKQTFAQKLMNILSVKECQSAIRWMPNGCAFCIVDSNELVEKVLPKYFKEAKYTSFVSSLLNFIRASSPGPRVVG